MTVFIRSAIPQDAAQLLAYLYALAGEYPHIDTPLAPGDIHLTEEEEAALIASYAASGNSAFLVAEAEGQIVGVLTCRGGKNEALRHAATLGITVARAWRGRGVGSLLIAAAVEWALQHPIIRRVELQVYVRNEPAIHLYRKFGFETEGRRRCAVYQNGEYLDDFVMALVR